MISTPAYYKVCADLIAEVCEVFGNPRLFHLGLDEEDINYQKNHGLGVVRQGDLWWHDAYFYFDEAEKHGARPWIWSDMCWHNPSEFVEKMPKSVMQSNWFYKLFTDYPADNPNAKAIFTYELLDKHGFEQIPTASCWDSPGLYNVNQTLAFGKDRLNPKLVRGYMTAPWWFTNPESEYVLKHDAHTLYCARREYYPETL